MGLRILLFPLVVLGLAMPQAGSSSAAEPAGASPDAAGGDAAGIEFFEKKIRPVLVARCYECHSEAAKELKGKLHLDSRAGLLAGGESGVAVVPGNVEGSLIIQALRYQGTEMPPKGKLPAEAIADFEHWVK